MSYEKSSRINHVNEITNYEVRIPKLKKALAAVMAGAALFSLTGCGDKASAETTPTPSPTIPDTSYEGEQDKRNSSPTTESTPEFPLFQDSEIVKAEFAGLSTSQIQSYINNDDYHSVAKWMTYLNYDGFQRLGEYYSDDGSKDYGNCAPRPQDNQNPLLVNPETTDADTLFCMTQVLPEIYANLQTNGEGEEGDPNATIDRTAASKVDLLANGFIAKKDPTYGASRLQKLTEKRDERNWKISVVTSKGDHNTKVINTGKKKFGKDQAEYSYTVMNYTDLNSDMTVQQTVIYVPIDKDDAMVGMYQSDKTGEPTYEADDSQVVIPIVYEAHKIISLK